MPNYAPKGLKLTLFLAKTHEKVLKNWQNTIFRWGVDLKDDPLEK